MRRWIGGHPRRSFAIWNAAFAILGVIVLVLKPVYRGPLQNLVYDYAGNVAVSFALYFAAVSATVESRRPRLLAVDFVANGIGVAVAVMADALTRGATASQDDVRPRPSR